MDDDRFERLTERQKECLRCVIRGLEVKEIARELGLSPSAVVERLRAARRALDVETSREAARLFAAHDQSDTNIRYGDMPPTLVDIPYPLASIVGPQDGTGAGEPVRFREVSAPFVAVDPYPTTKPRHLPMPWRAKGTRSNDMTVSERLLASGTLTITIAIGAAIILIAVVQLMTLLVQLSRHGG